MGEGKERKKDRLSGNGIRIWNLGMRRSRGEEVIKWPRRREKIMFRKTLMSN